VHRHFERSPRAYVLSALLGIVVLWPSSAMASQDSFNAKPFADYQNDDSVSVKHYEDYQKISRVLKQYIVAIDTLNEDLFGQVFTQDAVFEIRDDKERFAKSVAAAAAKGEPPPPEAHSWHMMSNSHIVFVDKDHALHNAYYLVWVRQDPNPGGVVRLKTPITLVAIGRYDDELVKVDGKWFIKRRRVTPDTSGGF